MRPIKLGKGRDDDATARAFDDAFQILTDHFFGNCVAGFLGVGRIDEREQHAFLTDRGDLTEIRAHVVSGREVEFEIAGVHDRADRSLQVNADAVGDRVVDAEKFRDEVSSELELRGGGVDFLELRLGDESELFQTFFRQSERQLRTDNRRETELRQNVRERADVVEVTVRDEDAANAVLLAFEEGDVRNHKIDAKHVVLGELQTAIDDDDVFAIKDRGHISPDFFLSAERYDPHFVIKNFGGSFARILRSCPKMFLGSASFGVHGRFVRCVSFVVHGRFVSGAGFGVG